MIHSMSSRGRQNLIEIEYFAFLGNSSVQPPFKRKDKTLNSCSFINISILKVCDVKQKLIL